jgi:hypothetical protein
MLLRDDQHSNSRTAAFGRIADELILLVFLVVNISDRNMLFGALI